jgi:replication factor A1
LLKEGRVYNLSFFQVKKANRLYKPVQNDIMISFTDGFTYSLTPIEKLPSVLDNKEYFTGKIL